MNSNLLFACFLLALSPSVAKANQPDRVGVLFGSFGDIDQPETELQGFLRNTLTDPDVLPLHPWLSASIADLGWYIERRGLLEEYAAIGGRSGMRQRSAVQAEAVAEALRAEGYDAKSYVGFTMTQPFVKDALARAQADQVKRLVVGYQGAQYSKVTAQIVFRHVREYLAAHPEWQVDVVGIRSFSDDRRFLDLLTKRIDSGLSNRFPNIDTKKLCVFLPMHGLVNRLVKEGDPYVPQVLRNVEALKEYYGADRVHFGFQNHDEIPFLGWTRPNTDDALTQVVQSGCSGVLINGLVSFTVDSLETLYDHQIDEPNRIADEAKRLGKPAPKVVVQSMFNADADFVALMGELIIEALGGRGDLENLRQ